ncbi:UNVERIFIED_CONTAM: hypothetical protein GTU68_010294 [Idotea baltica]|nr:hypothetical protein [Idotea baltica]
MRTPRSRQAARTNAYYTTCTMHYCGFVRKLCPVMRLSKVPEFEFAPKHAKSFSARTNCLRMATVGKPKIAVQ